MEYQPAEERAYLRALRACKELHRWEEALELLHDLLIERDVKGVSSHDTSTTTATTTTAATTVTAGVTASSLSPGAGANFSKTTTNPPSQSHTTTTQTTPLTPPPPTTTATTTPTTTTATTTTLQLVFELTLETLAKAGQREMIQQVTHSPIHTYILTNILWYMCRNLSFLYTNSLSHTCTSHTHTHSHIRSLMHFRNRY